MIQGERPIYMDHNATTPVLPEVVEAMLPYFTEDFGNPSSTTHAYGRRAAEAVLHARRSIARMIGASEPGEVIFTSGATESDNIAIHGVLHGRRSDRDHIVTSAIEHEAILEPCQSLAESGIRTTVIPVDHDGIVDPEEVIAAITDRTLLVSIMMANNEIGTVQPLTAIGEACRDRGVLFHTDAVQACGRLPVDVEALRVDLLSMTAHKMYGPKGIGALYVRGGVKLAPWLRGGGQEAGIRSGTLNVPAIVGFGRASEAALRDMASESERRRRLRDRLLERLMESVQDIVLNGSLETRLPDNLNIAIDGVDAEAVVTGVREVVSCSTGSACASAEGKGSYVVRALQGGAQGERRARSSVRFGLGRDNDEAQIDLVAEKVGRVVSRLREMAPRTARGADAGPARMNG